MNNAYRDIKVIQSEVSPALVLDAEAIFRLEQELLRQASESADQVARRNVFFRYRARKAHNTLRMQLTALDCFMRYLEVLGVSLSSHVADEPRLWQAISYGLVEGFQVWMLEEGYSTKTVNDYLGVVKRYAQLAHQADMMTDRTLLDISHIPSIRGIEAKRIDGHRGRARRKKHGSPHNEGTQRGEGGKKAEATYLTLAQVERLYTVPDTETPQGLRDVVALRLLYDLGLRPCEAVALKLGDLDRYNLLLRVYRQKTDTQQSLQLTTALARALNQYLAIRRDTAPDAPLLVQSRKNKHLVELIPITTDVDGMQRIVTPSWSTQNLWERVHLLGQQLGLDLASYDGRHQWARDAADAGTDYLQLTKAGGWKGKSRMADRYYGEKEIANKGVRLPR